MFGLYVDAIVSVDESSEITAAPPSSDNACVRVRVCEPGVGGLTLWIPRDRVDELVAVLRAAEKLEPSRLRVEFVTV